MTSTCDWAGCSDLGQTDIAGWQFCRRHLREHRQLVATDAVTARVRGPRPLPPPPAEPWLNRAYSGQRRPCHSWGPILDVLSRPDAHTRKQQAAS